ncbi:MAG TPA: fibronectin type III domain-containing protein, partial [Elusimicrobiota bacterium]|nr:fibronectin type III domain-containing protein [Elusimicrobiota bacterium]
MSTVHSGSPLRLNEVAPNESADWIELYVASTTPMGGWKVMEGGTTLCTFPDSFTPTAGQYVVLHLNTSGTPDTVITDNNAGYWDFYSADTGLTATDNVITVSSNSNAVLDALVYVNNNGSFTGNATLLNSAISAAQWNGAGTGDANIENSAVICTAWTAQRVFHRNAASGDVDGVGLSKNDWGVLNSTSIGAANSAITDATPPAAITNLTVADAGSDSITLTWTAVGDDGSTGNATKYYVRYSSLSILTTTTDYFNATNFANSITSPAVGTSTTVIVTNLIPRTTYWFIVVAEDNGDLTQGNMKLGSIGTNLPVSGLTDPDPQAPNSVNGVSATLVNAITGAAGLTWTAPSDLPGGGAVSSYVMRYATFSVASLSNDTTAWWNAAQDVLGEPSSPSTPGTSESMTISGLPSDTTVYFHIRAQDAINISTFSAPLDHSLYIPPHLLISEIASGIGVAGEEFVELYNPSTSSMNLASMGLQIRRRAASGGDTLFADLSGASTTTIPAKGFYLVATSTNATYGVPRDASGSSQISGSGTVYITVSGASSIRQAIDRISHGTGFTDAEILETVASALSTDQSLERNPGGGSSGPNGNGTDTNRSGSDFVLIAATANIKQQNVFSPREPNTAPGVPTVTYPNGSESLAAGAGETITWSAATDADGDTLYYDVDYSTDNGGTWVDISSGIASTSCSWTVPSAATTQGLVRVRAYDGIQFGNFDPSNANFTITVGQVPGAITNLFGKKGLSSGQINLYWTA